MAKKTKKVILLVEDEKDLRDIYKLKFTKSGYKIIEAENGEVAFQILEKEYANIDLMLLDIVMPKMDGYEVLVKIKENKNYKNIPIFILSNLGQEIEIKEGIRLSADKYLIKANYTPEEVVEKVEAFLK